MACPAYIPLECDSDIVVIECNGTKKPTGRLRPGHQRLRIQLLDESGAILYSAVIACRTTKAAKYVRKRFKALCAELDLKQLDGLKLE
jgi:hypothetical protein